MRKAKRKRLSSKCQKSRTHLRGPGENHQQPEEDELSLYGGSDLDDQIDRLVDTLYYSHCQRKGVVLVKRVKIVMTMTSSKILKMVSIWRNKLGNP